MCFPFANSRTGNLAISFREARSMRVLRLNSIETSALPETRGNVLRRNDVCDKVTVANGLSAASLSYPSTTSGKVSSTMLRFRSKVSVSDALTRRERTLFRMAATAASLSGAMRVVTALAARAEKSIAA